MAGHTILLTQYKASYNDEDPLVHHCIHVFNKWVYAIRTLDRTMPPVR